MTFYLHTLKFCVCNMHMKSENHDLVLILHGHYATCSRLNLIPLTFLVAKCLSVTIAFFRYLNFYGISFNLLILKLLYRKVPKKTP